MDHAFFVKGLILVFSIAAPVGPIGVLCIRRTLQGGRWVGLVTGLGAATADAFYGSIAAFGLTLASAFLLSIQTGLRLVGGLFLLYLGARAFFSAPAGQSARASAACLPAAYLSTFLLTLSNPATILSFLAIFAGLGFVENAASRPAGAVLLVLGVFSGSSLWWLLLSGGVSLLGPRLNAGALRWVNRVSGLLIGGFGFAAVISIF